MLGNKDAARALALAAKIGGRGLALKYGAIAATVFLILLIVFGLIAGGTAGTASAAAQSCGDRGKPAAPLPGGGNGPTPTGPLHDQQLLNAKTIDQAAKDGGLSGRATLIGLMTALQESSLIDLPNGDRDSIGLFQQRPSAGWGTVEQITHHPDYQAHAFYYGVGPSHSPAGLTQIVGWPTMSLGAAAQAVQHSAYPALYAGQENAAREIAKEAGIDLERPSTGAGGGQAQDPSTSPTTLPTGATVCYPDPPGQSGGTFHDGSAPWPDNVKNPRTTAQAIQWERDQAANGGPDWQLACLATVAEAYGWPGSGHTNPPANTHAYATELYRNLIPASMHHDGNRNPPPGALMFWDTGNIAGHVALYLGGGEVASSDILRPGHIDIVPATEIETKWGAKYLGWAPPYFPAAGQ